MSKLHGLCATALLAAGCVEEGREPSLDELAVIESGIDYIEKSQPLKNALFGQLNFNDYNGIGAKSDGSDFMNVFASMPHEARTMFEEGRIRVVDATDVPIAADGDLAFVGEAHRIHNDEHEYLTVVFDQGQTINPIDTVLTHELGHALTNSGHSNNRGYQEIMQAFSGFDQNVALELSWKHGDTSYVWTAFEQAFWRMNADLYSEAMRPVREQKLAAEHIRNPSREDLQTLHLFLQEYTERIRDAMEQSSIIDEILNEKFPFLKEKGMDADLVKKHIIESDYFWESNEIYMNEARENLETELERMREAVEGTESKKEMRSEGGRKRL